MSQMTFIYGELEKGARSFFQYKKGGRRVFFLAKKGERKLFFGEKKAGYEFFREEKRGTKTIFTGLKFPKPGQDTRQILVVPLEYGNFYVVQRLHSLHKN